ncbi:MAG TPA: hypothetical protein VI757_11705 [Bacteroidia bacterium]|nr:hypothetical protein [Bacteroidia bacterium]
MHTVKDEAANMMPIGLLLNELKAVLEEIYFMQQQGALMMPSKVSYPLSRNYAFLVSIQTGYKNHLLPLQRQHVKTELKNGIEVFVLTEDKKNFIFKSAQDENAYRTAQQEYLNGETEWLPYKIWEEDLQEVQNLPITAFSNLGKFNILTSVKIVSSFSKNGK